MITDNNISTCLISFWNEREPKKGWMKEGYSTESYQMSTFFFPRQIIYNTVLCLICMKNVVSFQKLQIEKTLYAKQNAAKLNACQGMFLNIKIVEQK